MRYVTKFGLISMMILLIGFSLLTACGDDEETAVPTRIPTIAEPTLEPTIIPEPTSPDPTTVDFEFYRNPDFPEDYQNPLDYLPIPQHPFLAPNGKSNMHNDAYMSDTYEWDGPIGMNPEIVYKSYADGINNCVTITYDKQGRILLTNTGRNRFQILLVDPETLDELAAYPLPLRDARDPLYPYQDTSGAVYFVLDNEDRVLLTDTENAIQIIHYNDELGDFEQLERFDLSEHIVPREYPSQDHVQMTIPAWDGELLWFTTRYGIVGTVNPDTREVHSMELEGEEFQNSFAVGEDGIYIVSDYAMYRFNADVDGAPVIDWRTVYERSSYVKPSNFNQGSGTTPQLFGDLVAIADNTDSQINILFLKRSDGSEVCRIPVFKEDRSGTENALPGLVREGTNGLEYSVIVDNNFGIVREDIFNEGRAWTDHEGGLTRIDLIPDSNGNYSCQQVWTSPEKSSQVLPKISLVTGLLYVYTYTVLEDGEYGWFFSAVDFETGETVFRAPSGIGIDYANFGPPLVLGPDGTAYIGTLGGLVTMKDR